MDAEDQIINEEQFIYEEEMKVCEHVLGEAKRQSTANIVAESSHHLFKRILKGVRTLHVLLEHAQPDDWAVDGAVILRTIHDAMLQLLWLLHDPAQRKHRAGLYLDYFYVEKLLMLAAIGESETDVAVLWDKHHPEANPDLRRDLTKFGPPFLRRQQHSESCLYDPKAYRDRWYPGGLRDLAKEVGYAGEHILQKEGSASVHSSLWALLRGPAIEPKFHLFIGARFCQRAAGAVAEALGIHLADDQVYKTERAKANIYNNPKCP